MRIGAAFPSTYLKAADLQGRQVTVTISHIKLEEVGGEHKPVMYFAGKERGLVLNKTNAMMIADTYGDETDAWQGQPVTLFEARVDFQGRTVAAIRVSVPKVARQAPPPPAPQAQPPRSTPPVNGAIGASGEFIPRHNEAFAVGDIADEIPF